MISKRTLVTIGITPLLNRVSLRRALRQCNIDVPFDSSRGPRPKRNEKWTTTLRDQFFESDSSSFGQMVIDQPLIALVL